ncbi:glycoside hydrolase family 2 protein [Ochrovirga pacifica]|uniref:glycoside hydrolase family 2 protein n=1 Tax=Ochrovirga pacifica TaxID=1042376 RepID=UPI0002558710|nr:glycoside hydrolase family 2 TIM barrel-domain containing protein [Ochrovirga pacifica]
MIFFKKNCFLLLFLTCHLLNAQLQEYTNAPRSKENINLNWQWKKANKETPKDLNLSASDWKKVAIPHNPDPVSATMKEIVDTWPQSNVMRDISWYQKEIHISHLKDELVFIEFEGVHSVTQVWVNGKFVGENNLGGYTPFHFNITPYIKSGENNQILVKADNRFNKLVAPDPHRTDYIKWGGIYRDVYIVKTNKLHVNFNWEDKETGVRITTPTVKRRYGITAINTTVANDYDTTKHTKVITKIVNADGLVLKTLTDEHTIIPKNSYTFKQSAVLEDNDYFTWSPDQPYLYRAVSYIYSDNQLLDRVENNFGFKKLELVDGQGLLLNGKPFFMIGANRHQSFTHIGDAVPNSLHYEEALRLKEAGFNTIRLSHYPQDNAFIDACDELGILIYEEPATWIKWEQGEWMNRLDVSARVMIRNHRNHPSIAIWGAGINHRGSVPRLAKTCKEEDPTRLTASASSPWNGMRHAGPTDIYATMDYRRSHWAEEGFTLLMEHGCNESGSANQFHISRYKKHKNNIGTLAWVAADYYQLKKKSDDPIKHSTYAILDMYRNKRPVYHWYKSELGHKDMVHIGDERVSKDGIVHVYSNADRVDLYANEKLISSQRPDNVHEKSNNEHPSFTFYYNWKDENLKAMAYRNGKLIATHERKSPGKPYALKLLLDYPTQKLQAGGSDIKTIRAYIVDKNGTTIRAAKNKVHFEVSGQGELVDAEQDYIDQMQAENGIASVYVRGTDIAGKIKIKATAKKLKTSTLTLETENFNSDEIQVAAKPIYDFPIYRVDIGHQKQLPQFDWTAWNIGDQKDLSFKNKSGIEFSISSEATIEWSKGEPSILGDLAFMGADGAFVKDKAITLGIKGLKKGTYKIITYHNATAHKKQYPYNINNTPNESRPWQTPARHMVGYNKHNDMGEREPIHYIQFFEVTDEKEIKLDFIVDKPNSFTWLNGFELRRVK